MFIKQIDDLAEMSALWTHMFLILTMKFKANVGCDVKHYTNTCLLINDNKTHPIQLHEPIQRDGLSQE